MPALPAAAATVVRSGRSGSSQAKRKPAAHTTAATRKTVLSESVNARLYAVRTAGGRLARASVLMRPAPDSGPAPAGIDRARFAVRRAAKMAPRTAVPKEPP